MVAATGRTAQLTIPRLLDEAVERTPDKEWLFFADRVHTYQDAHLRTMAAAAALRDLDIRRGSIVMAPMRNEPEYLFALFGIMRLGAALLPVDPDGTPAEWAGFLRQARPAAIVTDARLRDRMGEAVAASGHRPRILDVEAMAHDPSDTVADGARPDDVAMLIPTSGTTGRSKLVMQTQRAFALAGEGFPFWLGLTSDDRLMTSLPLFHVNAPAYSVLGSLAAGAGLVLLPVFSASRFLDEARRYGATQFNAIGAMLEMLMRRPPRDDDADNPLRLCYTGPAPSEERQLEIEARFGLRIVCGYALSESLYALTWRRGTRPYGTLGSARQHPVLGEINRVRVRNENGHIAKIGEMGELELNNPATMLGYYGMPQETAAVLVDGWLRTGDLVTVNDDETYTFVARKKEVIRRRGENLSPLEVEAALELHPAVTEAAVIGVASDLTEEDIKAFVVLGPGERVSSEDLREWLAHRLAPFKIPRYYEFVETLPHTATGRIAKHELPRERRPGEVDLQARPFPEGTTR